MTEPLHERLQDAGIPTLLVQFTDLHGVAKGKLVPPAHLAGVLHTGAGLAGPSIAGTGLPFTGPRSELYALAACGLDVLQIDHEDVHGQYELNFAYADALLSADRVMLFKLAAHALAEARGMVFSMMPKPFANQPGSGLHFHVSLWQGDECLFDAPAGSSDLSLLSRQFMAGVLAHARALYALAVSTVNSRKRLTQGQSLSGTTWAPATIAHGPNNRTAMIRTLPGRFEWRVPDASANPYLATAALIATGMNGIDRGLDPGPACSEDLFTWPLARILEHGIGLLLQSLPEALNELEHDAVLCAALGATLTAKFLCLERVECTDHSRHVSAWELDRYAAAF